jgi:hypothetical protein
MNYTSKQHPVPLVADASALAENALADVAKACLFSARNVLRSPADFEKPDKLTDLLTRTATSPTAIGNTPALQRVQAHFLAALSGVSAAARVLDAATKLSLDGVASATAPTVTMPAASWIAESGAYPVGQGLSTAGPTLSPFKLGTIIALTAELLANQSAEQLMRQTLTEALGPVLDQQLFSANAATASSPAGLLNGIAALTPSATGATSLEKMVADLQQLARALAPVAGSGTPILIAAPEQYISLTTLPPNGLAWPVYESSTLAAGTVIALVPAAIVASFGAPQIASSRDASLFMDTAGGPIGSSGPVRSLYQQDLIALKISLEATWARRSNAAVVWFSNAGW